jgi:release factor glutamine methyltransferase
MTLHEHVSRARERLERAGIRHDEAALDAEILARHLLGWDRATFLVRRHETTDEPFDTSYSALVSRRARRQPLHQIVGHREFWGLEFEISPHVLIPRPETELIVEEAVARFSSKPPRRVIDVGTGSGCLAIALALEFPGARLVATDLSAAALEVARRNAQRHRVADRVQLVECSLLSRVNGAADLIVSNPPYVPAPSAQGLAPEVRDHEPAVALFGGVDGLDAIRGLLRQAPAHLAPAGCLIFEFGMGQAQDVQALIEREPELRLARICSDLQGIDRVAVVDRQPAASAGATAHEAS